MADRPISYSPPMVRAVLREVNYPGTGKTQTRRILKLPRAGDNPADWQASTIGGAGVTDRNGNPVPEQPCIWNPRTGAVISPRHAIGDRLWVREAWRTPANFNRKPSEMVASCLEAGFTRPWCPIQFEADKARDNWGDWRDQEPGRLRAAMHLPRPYSRLTQTVTDVRIERLQEISEADALAEGIYAHETDLGLLYSYNYAGDQSPGGGITSSPAAWEKASHAYMGLWEAINGPDAWEANPWVVATTFTTAHHNIDAEPA